MSEYVNVIKRYKELTAKECYELKLCLSDEVELLDDKLGGLPYFPIGVDYPVDSEGNPLALLLQVNLKNLNLDYLKGSGILEIFISSDMNWPLESKIFLFEEGLEQNYDIPKVDLSKFVVEQPIKVSLEKVTSHMPLSNYKAEPILSRLVREELGEELYSAYDIEDLNLYVPEACIGGYPDFTQDDPRDESSNRDECLFKLDSNLNMDKILIGDSGILTVTISKEDMLKGNFNNAVADWDCC